MHSSRMCTARSSSRLGEGSLQPPGAETPQEQAPPRAAPHLEQAPPP